MLPFEYVCCMRKTVLTENGNFCLLLQTENRNGKLQFLFAANGNVKQKFVFRGRQRINSNRRLLHVSANVPIFENRMLMSSLPSEQYVVVLACSRQDQLSPHPPHPFPVDYMQDVIKMPKHMQYFGIFKHSALQSGRVFFALRIVFSSETQYTPMTDLLDL